MSWQETKVKDTAKDIARLVLLWVRFSWQSSLLTVALQTQSFSQPQFWEALDGTYGESVKFGAVNSRNHVFVGLEWQTTARTTMARSTDAGQTWTQINTLFSGNYAVEAVAINSNDVIFAAFVSGFFRSTDDGQTWSGNIAPPSQRVISIAFGESGSVIVGTRAGLFRSTTEGQSWTQLNATVYDRYPRLATGPNGDIYTAGDNYRQFMKSTNNGDTWLPIYVQSPNPLIAGFAFNTAGHVFVLTFYEGLFMSTNGTTWQQIGLPVKNVFPQSIAIDKSDRIFIATRDSGMFRSTNNGVNWSPIDSGFTMSWVNTAILDSSGIILAGTGSLSGTTGVGVFVSTDHGLSWSLRSRGLHSLGIHGLVANSKGYLFARGQYVMTLFRSTDGGNSWNPSGHGLWPYSPRAIAISPADYVFVGHFSGVVRSTNDGDDWEAVTTGLPAGPFGSITTDTSGYVYAGGPGGLGMSGVFRSTNAGQAWTPAGQLPPYAVTFLTVDNQNRVYAGMQNGGSNSLYRSTNRGDSWAPCGSQLGNRNVTSLIFVSQNLIFAATASGVYRSTDDGLHWQLAGYGGMTNTIVFHGSGFLFAGTEVDGVVRRSVSDSAAWVRVNQGFGESSVKTLLNLDGQLLAGTSGPVVSGTGGIYRGNKSLMGFEGGNLEEAVHYSLAQNYPNPFNPTTRISFYIPARACVELKVFDLLGREVATLVNEELKPGSYEKEFVGNGLASGIYLYQIKAGAFVQTRKSLLVR